MGGEGMTWLPVPGYPGYEVITRKGEVRPIRYWYGTEYLDTGSVVHLLSIGIIAEDGRTLHLVDADAPWGLVRERPWLVANVLPHLDALPAEAWLPRDELRTAVREFLISPVHTGDTELWAWFGAYPHVLLTQLVSDVSYGGLMMDPPAHIPQWTNDVRQTQWVMGNVVLPPQTNGQHDALEDAKHAMFLHRYMDSL